MHEVSVHADFPLETLQLAILAMILKIERLISCCYLDPYTINWFACEHTTSKIGERVKNAKTLEDSEFI
jgi:hypothetical protein